MFPLAAKVPDLDFVKITNPASSILIQELKRGLHEGEATCLALGIESKPLSPKLILDDVAARQVAKYHSLEFTGTLGCLLEAKRRGIIPNIKSAVEDLAKVARFWINPDLRMKILELAGE